MSCRTQSIRNGRSVLVLLCLVLSVFFVADTAAAKNTTEKYFHPLKEKLLHDKSHPINPALIDRLFANPELRFDFDGVSRYFKHSEAKLNYAQFLSNDSIHKARAFMKHHHTLLAKAEKKYGVDKTVIIAIMLVETRLGAYTGNQVIFNILSSMAALSNPTVREAVWRNLPKKDRINKRLYEKKANEKAQWAYNELKAYIRYTSTNGFDPFSLKGSYAGALGLAQFMPSNILRLGVDAEHNGQVDLFDTGDAVYSIANYLKYYGWKPGISREKAYKVIYHYNHSKYYVDTILKISDRLKG